MIENWIEHRRGDGERLGWIRPDGDGFHVIDLLGRQRTDAVVDWLEAEETLENLGIGYLADQYLLLVEQEERRVRITESSESRIVVVADDYGDAAAIGANPETFTLPFPAPDACVRSTERTTHARQVQRPRSSRGSRGHGATPGRMFS